MALLPGLLLLLRLLPAPPAAAASSPIFADGADGAGPVPFSAAEARAISEDILGVLDLPQPLRAAARAARHRRLRPDASAPSFMRDVYRELSAAPHDPARGYHAGDSALRRRYNVSAWLEGSLLAADLIVSAPQEETPTAHSEPPHSERRLLFRFDHLDSSRELRLLGSELRLFRHEFAYAGEPMRLLLHRLLPPHSSGPDLAPLVAETAVTELAPGRTGWLELNVTSFVRHWLARPAHNQGLMVRLLNAGGRDLPPDLLGIETRPGHALSPFVVASFREGADLGARRRRRIRRSARRYHSQEARKARGRAGHRRRYNAYHYQQKDCTRRELRVVFKDLNWDDWVIAPQVYAAYYCAGVCSFPNAPNTTNHSIVQTLLSLRTVGRSRSIPQPCCVPKKLRPMKMLYFDREQRAIMRSYRDMVVESCGCH